MLRRKILKVLAAALMLTAIVGMSADTARGEMEKYRKGVDYSSYIDYDRYIDIEVWTDVDEYYEGDNITVYFRANKDCYVVLYNLDSRGNVNILYPADRWDDSRVERDRTYRIPDSYDDYELTVRGPEGVEYIQAVASMMPLPIPQWGGDYGPVAEGDPIDYMDYINAEHFGKDNRIALDMTLFRVKEWHQAYYRPVYNYHRYDWNLSGMVYVDYPWGATIYVDGVYWGIAPLYIPRIYYGWHWITVYDRYGYCWEDRVHVYRNKTVILDNTVINTRAGVKSKYRDVRQKGYLNPEKNGYPDYSKNVRSKQTAMTEYKAKRGSDVRGVTKSALDPGAGVTRGNKGNSVTDRTTTKERTGSTFNDRGSTRERGTESRDNDRWDRSADKSRSTTRSTEKSGDAYDSRGSRSRDTDSKSGSSPDSRYKRSSSSRSSSSSSGEYDRSRSSGSSSSGRSSGSSSSGTYKRGSSSGSSGSSSRTGSSSGSRSGSSSGSRSSGSRNSGSEGSSKRGR